MDIDSENNIFVCSTSGIIKTDKTGSQKIKQPRDYKDLN